MGLFSTADTFYAFRFLRLLTTAWEDTGAFKAGLIDKDGHQVRKPETSDDRSVYNIFHRLVFNVKRLLNKIPLGKTTLASYITALYLIKEHTQMSEEEIVNILSEAFTDLEFPPLMESHYEVLIPGQYTLEHDIPHPKTGDVFALKGSIVEVDEMIEPVGFMLGYPIFEVWHDKTKTTLRVTPTDLELWK